ncbi:MAG: hypothetical protein QUU85_07195, partial [Candidatus Eisenbacteria bacterium]|nr:hypothetical protein [Candidatus Eisenbacteria bacterium]
LRTLAEIAAELPKPGTAEAMRARARVREILMNGLERPAGEMERSADRAAAVRGLLRLGDEPTVAFVDLRMQDESDPLVRRTYEYEKERMAEAAEAAR